MARLARRQWVPHAAEERTQALAQAASRRSTADNAARLDSLIDENWRIHTQECFNLNPATNAMNPRARAALASGLGERPSLGWAGAKYETGLEAIEEIEVIAAELAAQVFGARFAEIRTPSGAMANLFAFMAIAEPRDVILTPPAEIAGHVTHHAAGAAGLYGLKIKHPAVDAARFTVDLQSLAELAERHRPKLITIGGSLNLYPHPVAEIRAIADAVGAYVLFDAAHVCGMIAGGVWPNPLDQGAHLMTMSTYKSLGGPPGGLVLTNEPELAQRLDAIAYPGLTANFDAGRVAALAIALLDWVDHGRAYAAAMIGNAAALAASLAAEGLPVHRAGGGATASHQFALEAARFGGGGAMARLLRAEGFLASGIGLPIAPVEGDMNGLRLGTPELTRIGVGPGDMAEIAALMARALKGEGRGALAAETAALRARFSSLKFIRS